MVAYTFRRSGDAEAIPIIRRGVRAAASVRRTRQEIAFSDIPDSSVEQLKAMRRVGRPPLGDEPRQLIAIRVDAGVLDRFRKEARWRRVGYQINEVPARHVRKYVAKTRFSSHGEVVAQHPRAKGLSGAQHICDEAGLRALADVGTRFRETSFRCDGLPLRMRTRQAEWIRRWRRPQMLSLPR
jgi:uncharacterized protein (DUF4415 family)